MREYSFTRARNPHDLETYTMTEDQLGEREKEMLLAQAISDIDHLPIEVLKQLSMYLRLVLLKKDE